MTRHKYTHTCQVCKAEFPATINKDGSVHKRKYLVCSHRCYAITTGRRLANTPPATSPAPKGTRKSKPCKGCGISIGPLPPGQLRRKTYCTVKCSNKSRSTRAHCSYCWKVFNKTNNRKSFCSTACVKSHRRKVTRELEGIRRIYRAAQERERAKRKIVDDEIRAIKRIAAAIKLRSRECVQCGSAYLRRAPWNRFCSTDCEIDYKDTLSARRAEYAKAYRKTEKGREGRRIYKAARRAKEKGPGADRIDPIAVFERDNWRCIHCGVRTPKRLRGTYEDKAPELDHIVSLADGGAHTWGNVGCSCRKCNLEKGAESRGQLGLDIVYPGGPGLTSQFYTLDRAPNSRRNLIPR